MNFTSQICTTKIQSERLLALGLKKETADCIWCEVRTLTKGNPIQWHLLAEHINKHDDKHIPAWSLHRLKCLLPEKVPYGNGYLTLEIINENIYIVLVVEDVEQRVLKYTKGNLYDNLISCINFFVKENLFNKEYLE